MLAIVADAWRDYARQVTESGFLEAHSPPAVPIAPAVRVGRGALEIAARELGGIADATLERGWLWRNDEADVRYGLFRAIESVEAAAVEVAVVLEATHTPRTTASRRISPVTTARWALHGRLIGLDDTWLDRHPKAGEWTIREILGHIVSGQRAYSAYTAWWSSLPADDEVPEGVPAAVVAEAALRDEEEDGEGSLTDIRGRLDDVIDRGASSLAGLTDAQLSQRARWSGIPVDVGFRLGRWSSHVIEHTVQLDKTLDWLKRRPSEADRIVRDVTAAWGRLEALVVPLDPGAFTVPDPQGRTVEALLTSLGAALVADARSAKAAALA